MDDISFFDSGLYERRGGIWSDAARKPPRPKAGVPIPDEVQSVASAPLPDTGVSSFPAEYIAPLLSKSMDDFAPAALPSTTTADKSLPVPTVPQESSDSSHIRDSSRNSARRRTWFSSVAVDDSIILPSSNLAADANPLEDLETRGRPIENGESLSFSRSTSYSSNSEGTRIVTPERSEDEHKTQPPTYSSSRRSSSQHSVKGSSNEDTSSLQARSTPTTPSRNSDGYQIGRSPSPPSFFSSLKSKAADKQAISNTAKEAMRKWGVNWTGFVKKDVASEESSRNDSPPRLGPLEDNVGHKARASYAEVRAAVAERKERERMVHVDDGSATLQPSSPDNPVRTRTLSNSVFINESGLSAPRLSSKRSMSPMGRELDAQELPVTEEAVKTPPIHVQPQAKTMSIPGIHASHRGEVQSMGYVAPQVQLTPAGPSENVVKNPTIQSVYRLWKVPSGSVGPGTEARTLSGDSLSVATPPLAASQHTVKPTPPPLPPRSSPMAIPHAGSDTSADVFISPSSSASQALKTIALKDERVRQASTEIALTAPSNGPSIPAPTPDQVDVAISLETTGTVAQVKSPPPLPPRRTSIL